MKTYVYWYLFLPSVNDAAPEKGKREAKLPSREVLLQNINLWNAASAGKWQYWWEGEEKE